MSDIQKDIPSRVSWKESITVYFKPRVLVMFFLGFSAGLPFLLIFSTLTAWLTEMGLSRTSIGFFAWVGVTYSIKVFWAPVIDHLPLPLLKHLGKRRSWMLLAMVGIACSLLGMIYGASQQSIFLLVICAFSVAFCSATQDIAIDAYRIEALEDRYQGAMSAVYSFAYRLALLVSGAGALLLADMYSWEIAYSVMAALMLVGIITVLFIDEPEHAVMPTSLVWSERIKFSVVDPIVDFFKHNGKMALVILLFISVYRISDLVMGIMANPFYLDLGFTKSEIATIAKAYGFVMLILGSFVCGSCVVRYGIMRPLLVGAILVASTNVLFAWLATQGNDISALTLVISADNFSAGVASTAFIAYLSSLTNRYYTATQYALFSSLMTLPGKFFSGFSGVVVDTSGYSVFFIMAACLGLPAIFLVLWLMKKEPGK